MKMKWHVAAIVAAVAGLGLAALGADGMPVLKHDLLRRYFDEFNAGDEELYTNAFCNAVAAETIGREIPLFECPDKDIERTYYFRWWTYRKHIRRTKDGSGLVVTEFLPDVGWAGAENTIACPFGHHVREGRWLRDGRYLDSYIDFMLKKGAINGPRSYLNWPAWSALERARVTGDIGFARDRLDGFIRNFEAWHKGWPTTGLSLSRVENVQGAKGVPLQAGFREDRGLYDFAGDREGSEFALSADGARPMVNAAMWAEATAIAEIARGAGRFDVAARFLEAAAGLETNIRARLWNAKKEFFTTLSVDGRQDDVCELHGYAPFYFGMKLDDYGAAWKKLLDERGFYAPAGLTFPARDTPGFDVSFDLRRHECLWNGPSWPYATSIALTALYESLQRGLDIPVGADGFSKLLGQYARQHRRTLADGRVVPWIDENLDPFTGEWIARRHLIERDRAGIEKMRYRERGKDYNHSTFCDLVIAGLCGFIPQGDGKVAVRPLAPEAWDWWCIDGIRYHGHDVAVLFDRDGTRYGRGRGLVVLKDGSPESCGAVYIDTLDLSGSVCGGGWRTTSRSSVAGGPLSVRGRRYGRGFGSKAEGAVGIRLDGTAKKFIAQVAVDDAAPSLRHGAHRARMVFKVWTDGKIAWKSPAMLEESPPADVEVDLAGVRELVLETSSAAPWVAFDACVGDWLDARILALDGAKVEPVSDPSASMQLGILTPPEKEEPQINGADIWGVRPGHPVIFRVATSGERPMRFTARNVPAGVTFDVERGVFGGVAPLEKGDYDVVVTAENAKGRATRTIRLAVGDTIALTPPMGWNSWNIWGTGLTGERVMAAARAMDESGLGDHGWAYVNLDDYWAMNNSPKNKNRPDLRGPARDTGGKILPSPVFDDMKKLTEFIHSYGFKAGLYSSPGPTTCGGCEGSYGHEAEDAATWAEWGFDFVKYDWCSYDRIVADELGGRPWWDVPAWRDARGESKERPYRLMKECLLRQNRDIVYSFCQYGIGRTEEWARDAGANCWRSWDDLKDTWPWMEKAVESRIGAENHWKYAGPGCWVDPDMMIVGDQNSFGYTHPTCLTPNEQYTHVSIWCMLGAPLLLGCDLAKLDAFTRSLVTNDEVLSVDQDRLGRIARRIRHSDSESVWARPLADGSTAVALVNRYPFAREIRVTFAEAGLAGERWVRDLWRQKCEGRHYGEYAAVVPPHATKLVKMKPVDCQRCE